MGFRNWNAGIGNRWLCTDVGHAVPDAAVFQIDLCPINAIEWHKLFRSKGKIDGRELNGSAEGSSMLNDAGNLIGCAEQAVCLLDFAI